MKFPRLVLKKFCKTPCEVVVYDEGLTEDGAPKVIYECRFIYPSDSIYPSDTLFLAPLYCNYQDRVKTVYTSDKKKVAEDVQKAHKKINEENFKTGKANNRDSKEAKIEKLISL